MDNKEIKNKDLKDVQGGTYSPEFSVLEEDFEQLFKAATVEIERGKISR